MPLAAMLSRRREARGERREARGERREASGEWRVASGEWRVASGEWRVASGPALIFRLCSRYDVQTSTGRFGLAQGCPGGLTACGGNFEAAFFS